MFAIVDDDFNSQAGGNSNYSDFLKFLSLIYYVINAINNLLEPFEKSTPTL